MDATYDTAYRPSWMNGIEPTPANSEVNPATGKAWTFVDKLLGAAKKGADIYDQVKKAPAPQVNTSYGETPVAETFLGMPKNVGIGVTVVVAGLLAFGIYKLIKK